MGIMTRILLLVLLLASTALQAQIIKGWGIKTGVTVANQDWDSDGASDIDWDYRTGFNGAVFGEFLELPYVSVVAELSYTQKGMADDVTIITTGGRLIDDEIDNRLDYFSGTLFGKLRFPALAVQPYLLLGPRMDLFINSAADEPWDSIFDEFEDVVFGVSVGSGVEFSRGLPIAVLAELVYNADFKDSFKVGGLTIRNRSFDVRLGVRF